MFPLYWILPMGASPGAETLPMTLEIPLGSAIVIHGG